MIETARLILRRAEPGDLADLHAIMSDARAMQFWSCPPHRSLDQTEAYLAGMVRDLQAEDYMLREKSAPHRVIGKAGCWTRDEVGMLLAPDVWGKGYATEALTAILPRAFAADPDLAQIVADVDPRNAASIRVLEKLGFVVTHSATATLEVDGVWQDSVYLALTRPDQIKDGNRQLAFSIHLDPNIPRGVRGV